MKLVEQVMAELLTIEDPKEQLRRMLDASFDVIKGEDEHFWRLYFHLMMQPNLPTNIFNMFGDVIQGAFDWMADLFRKLGYEDPDNAARVFSALGDGVMLHYWMMGKEYPLNEVIEYMHKMYKTNK